VISGGICPTAPLSFWGGYDFQVKIRGSRIELGEIEAHLGRLIGRARGLWCWPAEEDRGDKRAGGFTTRYRGAAGRAEDLRRYLAARLRVYVPAVYVRLECLPLTPTASWIGRPAGAGPGGVWRRVYEAPQRRSEQRWPQSGRR